MMEQLTDHHYEVLTVPEKCAANCIYVKGPSKRDFLLHRTAEECPDSVSVSTAEESVLSGSKMASSRRITPKMLGSQGTHLRWIKGSENLLVNGIKNIRYSYKSKQTFRRITCTIKAAAFGIT